MTNTLYSKFYNKKESSDQYLGQIVSQETSIIPILTTHQRGHWSMDKQLRASMESHSSFFFFFLESHSSKRVHFDTLDGCLCIEFYALYIDIDVTICPHDKIISSTAHKTSASSQHALNSMLVYQEVFLFYFLLLLVWSFLFLFSYLIF
jgi:hypothetical protein